MAKNKYVTNVFNKHGQSISEMRIYTHIGEGGINAHDFANELNSITTNRVNIRINSIGGSVVDGLGVLSAMLNVKEKGVDVHTYNDGLAASTAGWLLLAAEPKNVHSKDYAVLMLHGVTNDVQGGLFESSIKTIFKNRAGIDVGALMTNGRDNFFSADAAARTGFFPSTNIENTGVIVDTPTNASLLEISNAMKDVAISNKNLKMKTIINLLKLQEGASEEVVAAAVQNALSAAKDAKDALIISENKANEAEATILELQGKVNEAVANSAKNFVESQIKNGKFTPKNEDEKTVLINQYIADPKGFETISNMMVTKAANVMDQLSTGDIYSSLIEKINNRSLRILEREDPKLLEQIKNEAKPEFVKLWNAEYKTNKTEADF